MSLVTIEPHWKLKQVVKQFWYTATQNPKGYAETYRILGDGAPGIIFQHNNGNSAVLGPDSLPLPISFAYGQSTQPCINHISGNSFVFGINFQPTAFKTLFGIDTSEITNAILDTENLFSPEFNDELLNTSTPQNIIRLFDKKLSELLFQERQNRIVDESVCLIKQNLTNIDTKVLSSCFNLSARQFQRKFKEYTGVCPETYIRISKFQRAISLLKNTQYSKLSDIAYELNYADQSHFNREFKLFSGYIPKSFLKIVTTPQPFYQDNHSLEPIRIVKHYA